MVLKRRKDVCQTIVIKFVFCAALVSSGQHECGFDSDGACGEMVTLLVCWVKSHGASSGAVEELPLFFPFLSVTPPVLSCSAVFILCHNTWGAFLGSNSNQRMGRRYCIYAIYHNGLQGVKDWKKGTFRPHLPIYIPSECCLLWQCYRWRGNRPGTLQLCQSVHMWSGLSFLLVPVGLENRI